MRVSVVVPVLVAEPKLAATLQRLRAACSSLDVEILIVVDVPDAGKEGEARAAVGSAVEPADAGVIYRLGRSGFGGALREGFSAASGDVVIPVMADDSDELETIPMMVKLIGDGYDVVAGSRYMEGGRIVGNTPKQRISRLYSGLMRAVGALPIHDVSNSFKAYRREVLTTVAPKAESFDLSVELVVKAAVAGFRIGEIPAVWANRTAGRSHFAFHAEVPNYGRWLLFVARARGRLRSARKGSRAR